MPPQTNARVAPVPAEIKPKVEPWRAAHQMSSLAVFFRAAARRRPTKPRHTRCTCRAALAQAPLRRRPRRRCTLRRAFNFVPPNEQGWREPHEEEWSTSGKLDWSKSACTTSAVAPVTRSRKILWEPMFIQQVRFGYQPLNITPERAG